MTRLIFSLIVLILYCLSKPYICSKKKINHTRFCAPSKERPRQPSSISSDLPPFIASNLASVNHFFASFLGRHLEPYLKSTSLSTYLFHTTLSFTLSYYISIQIFYISRSINHFTTLHSLYPISRQPLAVRCPITCMYFYLRHIIADVGDISLMAEPQFPFQANAPAPTPLASTASPTFKCGCCAGCYNSFLQ